MENNISAFTSFYGKVKSDISQIQKEYNESLVANTSGYLKENLEYFKELNSGGKLIRGFLISLGYKMLKEKAIPKASEWHGSIAGKDWHKKHYEQVKDKLHAKGMFVCQNCGKEFEAKNTGANKFCSNKCKSEYRRKIGVDNETRICEICGREFTTSRYSKTKTCSKECSCKLRWNKKN